MPYLITSEEMIILGLESNNRDDVFKTLCDKAVKKGYVEETFFEDLVAREKEFPTGLNTSIPISIAHVGTHCLESFLSIATLKHPIEFENMDGSEDLLSVRIVFVFGIIRPEEQAVVLRKLGVLFQEARFLEQLYSSKTPDALISVLSNYLGDMLQVQ